MSELDEGVDEDEGEGDLDLEEEKEYMKKEEGSVDDGVMDHGRRALQRFGGGDVEGL
jgi:hypothetical protein